MNKPPAQHLQSETTVGSKLEKFGSSSSPAANHEPATPTSINEIQQTNEKISN